MKTKRFKSENGVVTVIVALSIVALMTVTALAIDVGSLYEERRHLQTVADAAALAGVQELPENVDEAIEKAIDYASRCGVSINSSDVEVSSKLAENDTITVNAINPNTPLYFARVIGISETQVVALATAIVGAPAEYVGVVPWGVPKEEWDPGEEVVLKYGSGPDGNSIRGNFQGLAIDHRGANEYEHDIEYGADKPLQVGDMIDTEPGNMAGPTEDGTEARVYNYDNFVMDDFLTLADYIDPDNTNLGYKLINPDSQFILIPILPADVELRFRGRTEVEIVAFAPFIITGIHKDHWDDEFGNGTAITGTFLDKALVITEGGIIPVQSEGIRVVRLID